MAQHLTGLQAKLESIEKVMVELKAVTVPNAQYVEVPKHGEIPKIIEIPVRIVGEVPPAEPSPARPIVRPSGGSSDGSDKFPLVFTEAASVSSRWIPVMQRAVRVSRHKITQYEYRHPGGHRRNGGYR